MREFEDHHAVRARLRTVTRTPAYRPPGPRLPRWGPKALPTGRKPTPGTLTATEIKRRREAANWRQWQLASRLRLPREIVSCLETETLFPTRALSRWLDRTLPKLPVPDENMVPPDPTPSKPHP
jgi:hypothetical protein